MRRQRPAKTSDRPARTIALVRGKPLGILTIQQGRDAGRSVGTDVNREFARVVWLGHGTHGMGVVFEPARLDINIQDYLPFLKTNTVL